MLLKIPRLRSNPQDRPRVRELRALVTEVLGPIVKEECHVQHFSVVDGVYASVVATVRVLPRDPASFYQVAKNIATQIRDEGVEVSAAADVTPSNASMGFEQYATAMAETRAKGRCYASLLGLDIVTMEEIGPPTQHLNGNKANNDPPAAPGQIAAIKNYIRMISQKHGIHLDYNDVITWLSSGRLTVDKASDVCKQLYTWTIKPQEIPDELVNKEDSDA